MATHFKLTPRFTSSVAINNPQHQSQAPLTHVGIKPAPKPEKPVPARTAAPRERFTSDKKTTNKTS